MQDGFTTAHIASEFGYTEILALLLANKADVNAASKEHRFQIFNHLHKSYKICKLHFHVQHYKQMNHDIVFDMAHVSFVQYTQINHEIVFDMVHVSFVYLIVFETVHVRFVSRML